MVLNPDQCYGHGHIHGRCCCLCCLRCHCCCHCLCFCCICLYCFCLCCSFLCCPFFMSSFLLSLSLLLLSSLSLLIFSHHFKFCLRLCYNSFQVDEHLSEVETKVSCPEVHSNSCLSKLSGSLHICHQLLVPPLLLTMFLSTRWNCSKALNFGTMAMFSNQESSL